MLCISEVRKFVTYLTKSDYKMTLCRQILLDVVMLASYTMLTMLAVLSGPVL